MKNMNKKVHYGIMGVLLMISVGFISGCSTGDPTGNVVKEAAINADTAPDFELTTTSGKTISLAKSNSEGKGIVLYFMASWCSSCAKNWKALNEVYPEYKDKVDFVAVSIDPTDTKEVLQKLAVDKNFVFETVPGGSDMTLKYKVKEQTAKFAIDKNGNIVDRHDGVLTAEEWDQFFQKVT